MHKQAVFESNCLNKFLSFKDKYIEEQFNDHFYINSKTKFKLYLIICSLHSILYIIATICSFCFSEISSRYNRVDFLIKRLSINIIGFLISIITRKFFPKFCGLKRLTKYNDSFIFMLGFLAIIVVENPIYPLLSCIHSHEDIGYAMWWTSYELLLFCFFVIYSIRRWFLKGLLLTSITIYFSMFKYQIIDDYISIIKVICLCMIYIFFSYHWEKAYRIKFYFIKKLSDKEAIWKQILDKLPEGIVILSKDKELLYHNSSMLKSLMMNDNERDKDYYNHDIYNFDNIDKNNTHNKLTSSIILNEITKIKTRDDIHKLRERYKESLNLIDSLHISRIKYKYMEMFCDTYPTFDALIQNLNKIDYYDKGGLLCFDAIWKEKVIEIQLQPLFFDYQQCFLVILIDNTQRDLISKLEQNIKYKTIILQTVSHELRTPLNSTITMLQTGIDDKKLDNTHKINILLPCLKNLRILINLVNDILDDAQLNANKLKISLQKIDLKQVIYDACSLVEMQCKNKGLELIIDPKINYIKSDFMTDPNRLTQILLNLLSNSLKFTTKGYIKVSVNTQTNINNVVIIQVEDTGIGINKEDQNKLFTEFGKLDQGSSINPTGCGLGLNISQKLAILLGPSNSKGIQVLSELNQGSKFYFPLENKTDNDNDLKIINYDFDEELAPLNKIPNTIKINLSPLSDISCYASHIYKIRNKKISQLNSDRNCEIDSNSQTQTYIPSNSNSVYYTRRKSLLQKVSNKFRILVVDDNYFNQYSIEILFKSIGILYDLAYSGQKAIEMVLNKGPEYYQLILMDYNMPIMSGIQATKILIERLKQNNQPIMPIYGYTAYINDNDKRECLEAGMVGVILKPLNKEQLLSLIESIISLN